MKLKLVVADHFPDERRAMLTPHLETDWEIVAAAPGERAAALRDADACISMAWPTGDSDGTAPRLRLVQLPGAGLDMIDGAKVPGQAAVCNVFELEIGIAEYVLAVMLEHEIGIARLERRFRAGDWTDSLYVGAGVHGELLGRTLGIVGYGRIGRETAKRATAFGMRTLAANRTPGKTDEWVDTVVGMDRLDEVLAAADYLLVACPLDETTRGLIDGAALARMPAHAVVINVARGPVIDEDALFDALKERRIGGAVIDTWYTYPSGGNPYVFPSRHPFQALDNVMMTPHVSGWSRGLLPRRFRVIAQNLNRLARGEPLLNLVQAPLA